MNIKFSINENFRFTLNGSVIDHMRPTVTYPEIVQMSGEFEPTVTYRARFEGGEYSGILTKDDGLIIMPGLKIDAMNTGGA